MENFSAKDLAWEFRVEAAAVTLQPDTSSLSWFLWIRGM
jgi:hypothetical protein